MPGSLGFVLGLPSKRWGLKRIQVTMKTWSIGCHIGIHVDFNHPPRIHTLPLVPPKRGVNRTWTGSAFSTNGRAGRVYWSRALMSLVCEVALITSYPRAFQLCLVYQVTGTIDAGPIRGLSGRQKPGQVSNPSQTLGRIFC